jgi:sterol desaturase/sphingolipid hydroxylase (fatty acid hydroxylase superfamily)
MHVFTLHPWLAALLAGGFVIGIVTGFFKARKIQPGSFKWKVFRNEIVFATINLTVTAFTLGPLTRFLTQQGVITARHESASWWLMGAEYAAYFLLFDTWFYWWHRLMHREPFYRWIHKIHHRSTAPNLLTTVSESPLESLINGGFVPLFLSVFAVHDATLALILPTNILMGLYVHSGFEFLPRWWYKSWATKWFITTTFHDQHHKYFRYNFGGYTSLWDYACGTLRPKFVDDFERKRPGPAPRPPQPEMVAAGGGRA